MSASTVVCSRDSRELTAGKLIEMLAEDPAWQLHLRRDEALRRVWFGLAASAIVTCEKANVDATLTARLVFAALEAVDRAYGVWMAENRGQGTGDRGQETTAPAP